MPRTPLLTPHGSALIRIAQNPNIRVRDLADDLGITERAAQRFIADLIEIGYIERRKNGRRNVLDLSDLARPLLEIAHNRGLTQLLEPAPQSGSRSTSNHESRSRILAGAEQLMVDGRPFSDISVEEVITLAQVARSTFYAYFQDKDDLLETLTVDLVRGFRDAVATRGEPVFAASADDLRRDIERMIESYLPSAGLLSAASDTWSAPLSKDDEAVVAPPFIRAVDEFAQFLSGEIAAGQQEHRLRDDLDPDAAGRWLAWGMERGLSRLIATKGETERTRSITALTNLIESFLYEGNQWPS